MRATPPVVSRLLAAQFPQWADLPPRRVDPDGWDNVTYRLGDSLSVRLPSADCYAAQVEKEHRWSPLLAPRLPFAIPQPVARGVPSADFPMPWSVYRWLDGDVATVDRISDLSVFASDVARFLAALRDVDPVGGPRPGLHSWFRGGPLSTLDGPTRRVVAALDGTIDRTAVSAVWDGALDATTEGPDTWVHGDVTGSNLLVVDGHLSAVIDFGCCAVGDPACDVAIAWTLFHGESRRAFRAAIGVDDATWERGRGWALWKALIDVPAELDGETEAWRRMGWRVSALGVVAEVLADAPA